MSLSLYTTSICLFHLVLYCHELTSITIVIIGMTLYEPVLHYRTISYYIISYLHFIYLFCWLVLHCIVMYFISVWFDSIQFYSIHSDWIWFMILFSIVSHIWLSICPSVRQSDCLYLHLFISFCFLFFSFSYRLSFLSLF